LRKILLLVCLIAVPVNAQSPVATPNSLLEWDQAALDVSTAQSYIYKYYLDGSLTGFVLSPINCVANGTLFNCSTKFPTISPGTHTLQLTAGNEAGESLKSSPFGFAFVTVPITPGNIRIRGGG